MDVVIEVCAAKCKVCAAKCRVCAAKCRVCAAKCSRKQTETEYFKVMTL